MTGGISNNYFATGDLHFTRDKIDMKINYNPSAEEFVLRAL